MVALGAILIVLMGVLVGKLYRLMIVRYDEYQALSIENQFKNVRVRALRGYIFDRRRELLVAAQPSLDVFITPAFCAHCARDVLPELARLLRWEGDQYQRALDLLANARGAQRYQPLPLQSNLSRDDYDVVSSHLPRLAGVELEAVPHREYRAGGALAHVIGFMNEVTPAEFESLNLGEEEHPPYAVGDYVGRRGLERAFEASLRGIDGWSKEVVNARGEVMRDEAGRIIRHDEVEPTEGNSLILSIDARLQAATEHAFTGVAGAVVVMETKTGFIRAIASYPSFDPTAMTGRMSAASLDALVHDPLKPLLFRPTAEHYHPGSTFKVVTALAALESRSFTPDTMVDCEGGYLLGNRWWRCDNESGHGWLNLRTALTVSCDTYFYRVADVLGIEPIAKMARQFGLGETTGFGVTAEVPGIVPDESYHQKATPGGYRRGAALNAAIGQGAVNVTPMQMAVLYSAIANGGDVMRPQLVSRIESTNGTVVKAFGPEVVRHIDLDERTRRVVVDALNTAVNGAGGTGFRAALHDVAVAGKTGTAQVAKLGLKRLKAEAMNYWVRDHAWFAAFAPADDPELTVVVIDEHAGFGGASAAPVAGAIFEAYFSLKNTDGSALPFGALARRRWTPPLPVPPSDEHLGEAVDVNGDLPEVAMPAAAAPPDAKGFASQSMPPVNGKSEWH